MNLKFQLDTAFAAFQQLHFLKTGKLLRSKRAQWILVTWLHGQTLTPRNQPANKLSLTGLACKPSLSFFSVFDKYQKAP